MYSIYAKIRDEKGFNDYTVSKACGISAATFTDWKKGKYTPKADKIKKIADLLEVSTEYLTTGRKTAAEPLSAQERELIEMFRKLNDIGRIDALETISNMLYVPKYTQKKEASSHSA